MACDQGTDLGPSALASRCSCDALSNPCLRRVPPQGLHRCIAVARLTRLQWALLGGNPVLRLPRPGECRAWTFGPSDSWPDCRANDCYGGARFGGPLDPIGRTGTVRALSVRRRTPLPSSRGSNGGQERYSGQVIQPWCYPDAG